MPLYTRPPQQVPDAWQIFGHSYYMHSFGGRSIMGRPDAILRAALDIEHTNFQNFAVSGSRLAVEGYSQGGYGRLYQAALVAGAAGNRGWISTTATSPYVQYGGTKLLGWGLNDAGISGSGTTSKNAYTNALRAAIAVCRASRYHDTGSASIAYSGWTNVAGTQRDWALTLTGVRTATTAGTITFTIPADYQGTPITFLFNYYRGNTTTLTFSGTAGVTTTVNPVGQVLTGPASPPDYFNHSPLAVRITTLTTANAGQTIICTGGTHDATAGTELYFDGILIESVDPGLTLVTNLNRIPSAGYSGSYGSPTDSTAISDANIAVWNTAIATLVAEFDPMVQLVDVDSVIQSTGNPAELLATDNLHPNELGASLIAEAYYTTLPKITATKKYGKTAQINNPARRFGAVVIPRISANWYTTAASGGAAGTAYTPVSGDMFALPYYEAMPDGVWSNWSLELVSSTVATTVRFAVYDDRGFSGYPQSIFNNLTSSGALSLTTAAGVKVSPSSGNGSFAAVLATPPDPGLYWLVVKFDTAGTSSAKTLKGPDMFMPTLSTTGLSTTGGYSGYKLTGQGTATLPTTFPTGGVLVDNCPVIGLKYT